MKLVKTFMLGLAVLLAAWPGFTAEPAVGNEEPKELIKLRDQYESTIKRMLRPVTAQYKRSLTSMLMRFTQLGNTKAAKAVQDELGLLEERTSDLTAPTLTILEATWGPIRGKTVDVTKKVRNLTADNKLQLKAGSRGRQYYKLFGNPKRIVTKYLTIRYKYAGRKKKVRFSQHEDVSIP